MRARTTALSDGITAIDTEYARPQQDASHLVVEQGRAAVVDTGVNASVSLLLDALEAQQLDVGDVDYVFLTHVHLDHAGGAGLLLGSPPNARRAAARMRPIATAASRRRFSTIFSSASTNTITRAIATAPGASWTSTSG